MALCQHCGKEIGIEDDYCPYCGNKNSFFAFDSSKIKVDEEEYRTFIGKKADYYLNKFRKFQFTGTDHFAVTWHWPAFWLGFAWMLYRKMYLWALVAFLIALTQVGVPLTMVACGLTANYLYYLHVKKKILGYRSSQASGPSSLALSELGGVNRWVWFVGFLFILLLITFMCLGLLLLLYFLKYKFLPWPEFIEV